MFSNIHKLFLRSKSFLKPSIFSTILYRCVNGKVNSGRCTCDSGYIGKHCELKMNCGSNERNPNGSCRGCKENFSGRYCEEIQCANGKPEEQKCVCEKPYSGEFCDQLTTADVYLYYNKKMASSEITFKINQ